MSDKKLPAVKMLNVFGEWYFVEKTKYINKEREEMPTVQDFCQHMIDIKKINDLAQASQRFSDACKILEIND